MNGKKIAVIGAGTWGMALTRMLSNSGLEVTVWSALPAEIEELEKTRRQKNLPNMEIPEKVVFTKHLEQACLEKDILLFAVPSVFVRPTAKKASPFVTEGQIIVDVAKGIEPDSNQQSITSLMRCMWLLPVGSSGLTRVRSSMYGRCMLTLPSWSRG